LSLTVLPDEPPDRHAVFRNWPVEDDEIKTQAKRMLVALKLAEEVQFIPIAKAP
jgi:hypothetical protein